MRAHYRDTIFALTSGAGVAGVAVVTADQPQQRRTLRAIDSLIGALDADKQTLRSAFPQLFKEFVVSASKARF